MKASLPAVSTLADAGPAAGLAQFQADQRPVAGAQRQQQAAIDGSPRQVAQRRATAALAPTPRPNATGLPDHLKAGVENLSGHSLDDVQVHYNSAKPAALQAHAYAQGTDIHLAPGQEQHLPHEAWHVAQQKQGRVRPTTQLKGTGLNDSSTLENEADLMGRQALQAGPAAGLTLARGPQPAAIVQRIKYQLTEENFGQEFDVLDPDTKEWVRAILVNIEEGMYEEFEVTEPTGGGGGSSLEEHKAARRIQISNQKNIREVGEEGGGGETSRGKGLKKSYFHKEETYGTCQFPECAGKEKKQTFSGKEELYEHLQSHKFPERESYPYMLFGGQDAMSHVLSRDAQPAPTYEAASLKTGNDYHSEWRVVNRILGTGGKPVPGGEPPAKRAKKQEPQASPQAMTMPPVTTSVEKFMSKKPEARHLFLTGEPHCGLCTNTLPKAGLPVAYPTNARPSQSPGYKVPPQLPGVQQVLADFGGSAGQGTSRQREQFPKGLKTALRHNEDLRLKYREHDKANDGEQYLAYMAQAMAMNKWRYGEFFSALAGAEGPLTRKALKQQMRDTPIPKTPHTFDDYVPSDDEQSSEEEVSDQQQDAPHDAGRMEQDQKKPGPSRAVAKGKKPSGQPDSLHRYPTFTEPGWNYQRQLLPDSIVATGVGHGDIIEINGNLFRVLEDKTKSAKTTDSNPMGLFMKAVPHLRGG